MAHIETEHFTNNLFALLEETFETHHGIFLDRDTSLLTTLETVSAQEASIPVGGKCASLAAQTAHVTFYLDVLYRYVVHNDRTRVDWGEIWRIVEKVDEQEWQGLRDNLHEAYQRIRTMFEENAVWNDDSIGGAMAIVVHTAYHLGEIRQALCVLKK